MRAGRIARIVGRATVVGLLGLGGFIIGSQTAVADDFEWDAVPAAIDSGSVGDFEATLSDFEWD